MRTTVALTAAVGWTGVQGLLKRQLGRVQYGTLQARQDALDYPAYTFDQPIDHFSNSSRYEPHTDATFKQRYFFDDSYYKPGVSFFKHRLIWDAANGYPGYVGGTHRSPQRSPILKPCRYDLRWELGATGSGDSAAAPTTDHLV
ncbi:hypothetical protein LTR53_011153 [Teratosphaeriaceae sp. CCFEE 6253]|nr:hypothetical protein LTR53_011153 [Teratosphaeriaceae sp. CCFEE 6253]